MKPDYTTDAISIVDALHRDCPRDLALKLVRTFLEKAHTRGKIEATGELSVHLNAAMTAPKLEAANAR